MADGSVVKTQERVQVKYKCGEYKGGVYAQVFPNKNKPMILGIPWLSQENPHIDWKQATIVIKQGQKWISLPLEKP